VNVETAQSLSEASHEIMPSNSATKSHRKQKAGLFTCCLGNVREKESLNYNQAISVAESAKGKDEEGYKAELIRMAEPAQILQEFLDHRTK
jgi:hypothetical protein